MNSRGFSLLELTIAIFIVAIVLGTVLLVIASNLGVVHRANEMMISSTLLQYQSEVTKNIEFPPVYVDRQDDFGTETRVENPLPGPGTTATDYAPSTYSANYRAYRYVTSFTADGKVDTMFDSTRYDSACMLKLSLFVMRKKDPAVVGQKIIYVSRSRLY